MNVTTEEPLKAPVDDLDTARAALALATASCAPSTWHLCGSTPRGQVGAEF